MLMRDSHIIKKIPAVGLFLLLAVPHASGQIDFPAGSGFRYLKGKDAANLSPNWIYGSFDDSGWSAGDAPIRYGDGEGGTVLDDMQNSYSTVYMRSSFLAQRVDSLTAISLLVNYDDGFVIWINGKMVLSQYAPALLTYDGFATELHESGQFESFLLEPGQADLVEGENTLAIMGFNQNLESTDFLIDIAIHAEATPPVLHDTAGLKFSVQSGFYENPFYLEIMPSNPLWNVLYTIDGSNPQTSATAVVETDTARIWVDPGSYDGRPRTGAFIVRASSSVDGIIPSVPESRTFIFLDEVLAQEDPGGGWPTGPVNNQAIDLVMDQRIVYHPYYEDDMILAMTDIPSISVITDLDNLFNPETGIYVNAWGHGFAWERECSVELINPDGTEGFNVNAGLRIRGGWSRHPEFPKHAFRLFFRSDYGDSKLYFPLFGDEGVDRFDKIDLRTAQNWAWTHPYDESHNTFLRDVFSRDTQGEMGQPYTRSRFYHLFLNGMYWGLFQTQERSEARFAADYLGGNTNDYDVVKVDTEDWRYRIEASDGNLDAWKKLWDMCSEGFQDNSDYFFLQGRDAAGNPVAGGEVLLDIDNLIDYMLTIFYTANFDSPTSSFGSNKGPNNFFAIYNREDPSSGFQFFNHDAEHSLFAEEVGPGMGLYEDRVNLTERTDGKNMEVSYFDAFHPQWLHHKLTDNEEYRIRFRDRAHLFLEDEGVMTPEKSLARLNRRASEIEWAIIGESARWGDAKTWLDFPSTKLDHWVPEVNKIRDDFIPYRTDIVLDQLEEGGLFSYLETPAVYCNGNLTHERVIPVSGPADIIIENTNSSGEIWYTTDGSDPRAVGGEPSGKAHFEGTTRAELTFGASAMVRSRIYDDGEWSALREVLVMAPQDDFSQLVVTELNYHPLELVFRGDTLPGQDLEFIEFKNTGHDAINLSGLVLDSAVYYEFPGNTLLGPGQFYVVASKPSAFFTRYGLVASGNYQRNLANEGEEVLLRDTAGARVIDFVYDDHPPWPAEADGEGYSLVSAVHDPVGDPADYTYWKASSYIGGSPFRNDPYLSPADPAEQMDEGILLFPNPTSGILNIRLPEGWACGEVSFRLYGIGGNLIYQTALHESMSIWLDQLNITPGVYVVRISGSDMMLTQKIIFR
jgi:hypothetical protein